MTPPPSSGQGGAPHPSPKPQAAHARTRTSSNAASLSKRGSGTPLVEQKVHYTVLIRLPFARRDFVDPAQVDWDQTKDQALWKIISRPKEGARDDIDWQDLASRFGCSSGFLLQQAAWLYERHLNHVRAQMRKVGSGASGGGSGSGTGNAPGSIPMKRGGSGGGNPAPRTASALSMRSRDSPVPPARISTAVPSQLSRTPSATTITQSRGPQTPASPRQPVRSSFRSSFPPPRRASPTLETTAEASRPHSRTLSPTSPILSESESESSSSDDDKDNPIRRSQLFKRPPRFMARQNKPPLEPRRGGRPLSEIASGKQPMRLDSSATSASTNDPRTDDEAVKLSRPGTGTNTGNGSRSGSGSNQHLHRRSTQPSPFSPPESRGGLRHGTGALSPGGHHRTELARLGSPRGLGSAPGSKRGGEGGGSEGAPSMGSSFSDLDDASVTQSALEEQLLSHMQHAGGLSKMSTISQALRSRYL
ncbi:hypothetical protein HDK77DRAFT_379729 [Phyllosticta capitalensis]|uniref:Autophagy-related protein 29 n=1 Tax=Phyllosticta capitalensis TaxID=121624 RepID=A0ABR1YIG9_9PEZI